MRNKNEQYERVHGVILDFSAYLVLLIQQIPGIWIWVPLMAAPVFLILGAFISNISTSLTEFYTSFIMMNEVLLGKIMILLGLIIAFSSIVYLGMKKRKGLVVSGPYRFIRHPQYTGFLLLTIGFTGWSYYYITRFFGIGWLSADATIVLWCIELFIYIFLAFLEDKYLLRKFNNAYADYKKKTPSFIPFVMVGKYDTLISILIFSFLLYLVIQFPLL